MGGWVTVKNVLFWVIVSVNFRLGGLDERDVVLDNSEGGKGV